MTQPAPPGQPAVPARPKPSWPMLLVAALSFVPGIGFVYGSVAVTWGLVTSRRHGRLAVMLGSVGAFLTIVEAAVVFYVAGGTGALAEARVEASRQDLQEIAAALEAHRTRSGSYPDDLLVLVRPGSGNLFLNVIDRSASLLSREPYRYRVVSDSAYELFAVGPDGLPDTPDDIRRRADSTRPAVPARQEKP